jgi:O-antigen ligase
MQRISSRIHFFLLTGLAISLTFSFDWLRVTSLLVILIAVNALVLHFSAGRPGAAKGIAFFVFIAVYLMHLPGLLATQNIDQGFFELEKKLSLLIFPLVFFFTPELKPSQTRTLLMAFVWSCALAMCICFVIATTKFLGGSDTSVFQYHDLSEPIGMHAAYLSMYLCVAIAIQLYVAKRETKAEMTIFIGLFLILGLGTFLLAARAQILILVVGLTVWIVAALRSKYGAVKALLAAITLGVGLFAIALLFPLNRERFMAAVNYDYRYKLSGEWGEQQMRVLIWSCAGELISQHPVTGTGIGDGEDDLQLCYISHEYISLTIFENTRFNAHNQYLEIAIQLGFGGLLIYVLSIIVPSIQAGREKNRLYIAFMFIFGISCMTESMLESQSGIIFFAFFNSFLFINHLPIVTQRKTELESRQKQTV